MQISLQVPGLISNFVIHALDSILLTYTMPKFVYSG